MTVPTIHPNGDTAETLTAQLCAVAKACRAALAALRNGAPNGRNYYPQAYPALLAAQAQYAARCAHIQAVLDSVTAEALAIQHPQEHPSHTR